jgi:hypothetical protein
MRNLRILTAAALLVPGVLRAQDPAQAAPELPGPSEHVRVENRLDAREAEFIIGPVELPGDMLHLRLPVQMVEIPVDGWLHGFEAEIVDADGKVLPAELLHHVNFIDPDNRELFYPIARRVFAAGRETQRKEIPRLLGYPIQAGDRLIVSAMFTNATGSDVPEAYLHVRISYSLEEDGFLQPRDVYPFYLDVMGPVGAKDFPVPPGKTVLSWQGSPAIEGRIVGIGGHVHNFATLLGVEDVTTGKTIWETAPELDETGQVTGMPEGRLWWRGGVKIYPDHVYRVYVEYDNPTSESAPDGGMGEVGGLLWAPKDVRWPEFDRDDPKYVADLINTLEAPERMGGHGHGTEYAPAEMDDSPAYGEHEHQGAR